MASYPPKASTSRPLRFAAFRPDEQVKSDAISFLELGFRVNDFKGIGRGAVGYIYKGICTQKAIRYTELPESPTQWEYSQHYARSGERQTEVKNFVGKEFAVKLTDLERDYRALKKEGLT